MPLIPKRLLQTWKDKANLSPQFAHWRSSFLRENPDYEHWLWDDDDNRRLIQEHFPWFLAVYDAYPREIYRVDAMRYFFLYCYGGIYADLDSECLRPLDPLLDGHGHVVLGRMGTDEEYEHSIPNAVMLSAPRAEFWLLAMSRLLAYSERNAPPEYCTGPVVLKEAYNLYTSSYTSPIVQDALVQVKALLSAELQPRPRSRMTLLPGHSFYPLDWTDQVHQTFFRKPIILKGQFLDTQTVRRLWPRSYIVSFWSHSWEPQPGQASS